MALTGGAAILARLRSQRAANAERAPEPPVVIIAYASQTGTAQDIAQSINAECNERKIKSKVVSLNDLKFVTLSASKTPLVVTVVSTTGDGDPPDNSQTFFKDMKKAKSGGDKMLKGVKYTCLGLGDSNYTSFMAIPLRLKKGFDELGAERFYGCSEVDEVDGLEDLVEEWIEGLWEPLQATLRELTPGAKSAKPDGVQEETSRSLSRELSRSLDLKGVSDSLLDFKLPSNFELQGVPAMPVCSIRVILSASSAVAKEERNAEALHHRFAAPLVSAQKLTAEWSDREVYDMVVDLEGSGMTFSPGDSLDVLPENDPVLVEKLLERLKLDGSQFLSLEALEGTDQPLPHLEPHHTLSECFLHSLDVSSALKKTVLRFLAQFCQDQGECDRLKYLVSKPGREAYHKFIISAKASLLDVLNCFPSCQPSLAGLLELLPPLMPRMYSIACSPKVSQSRVRIAFSVAKYSTPYGERVGVATGWLKGLINQWQGSEYPTPHAVPVCIRPGGSFRLPTEIERPLVLIGPGTGVTPFLGFLEERKALAQVWQTRREQQKIIGSLDEDYLFRNSLEAFHAEGTVAHFHVAFSRKTEQKIYVQHLMLQESEALHRDLFQGNGFVFVCGDGAAMAQDVHKCLTEILIRHGELSEAEAKEKLTAKLKDLTYVKDIWS